MTSTAQRLFGVRVRASHAAAALTESSAPQLCLARTTGRTVLHDYEDAPVTIEETDGGLAILGGTHALLLTNDGDVVVKRIGEAKPSAGGGERQPLPSKNEDYGFQGSVKSMLGGASRVYRTMFVALLAVHKKHLPETIRRFLDGKQGRHLADQLTHGAKNEGDGYALDSLILACAKTAQTGWISRELDTISTSADDTDESVDESKMLKHFASPVVMVSNESDASPLYMVTLQLGDRWVSSHDDFDEGSYQSALAAAKRLAAHFQVDVTERKNKAMAESRDLTGKTEATEPNMKTRLQEEDYADIVMGENGLLLIVNGEQIASEDCDLNDEDDCTRAEEELGRQASALGYTQTVEGIVLEGTFDASNEKGGKVVNGDDFDDWQSGEGYYARRYRRRTSNAQTGAPTQPALESIQFGVNVGLSSNLTEAFRQRMIERLIEAATSVCASGACYMSAYGAPNPRGVTVGFVTEDEAQEFVDLVANMPSSVSGTRLRKLDLGEGKIPPQFLKKKKGKKDDDEDEEDPDDDEGEGDDDDADEGAIMSVRDFLAEHVDPNQHIALIREFDRLVLEGHYEAAVDQAESIAVTVGKLDEYKRRTGSSLTKFRRSLKTQTSAERSKNRERRKSYRTDTSLRRKAKKYRVRVKRFMRPRKHESVTEDAVTKRDAKIQKKAGMRYAVWSTDEDVTFHKTLADAQAEAKKNPKSADPDMGGRTWTDIDELIGVLESDDHRNPRLVDENYADDSYKNANDGKEGPDTTFSQCVAGAFSDLKGAYTGFAGLKERVAEATGQAVSDPKLMRIVSEFVNVGLIRYTPGKGYALVEVEAEALGKLAKAARIAGNKFVVTIAGGTPMFLPTREDANALWKQLPPKLRGIKTTISGYVESLGVEDAGEDGSD